jgi:hypothetical protein
MEDSDTMVRNCISTEFYSRTDVEREDTMGTGRPSGVSTIIESTPPTVPFTPLKAQALSDLWYTYKHQQLE